MSDSNKILLQEFFERMTDVERKHLGNLHNVDPDSSTAKLNEALAHISFLKEENEKLEEENNQLTEACQMFEERLDEVGSDTKRLDKLEKWMKTVDTVSFHRKYNMTARETIDKWSLP